MNGRRWTSGEVWLLRDLAQEVSQREAARQLERSLSSVVSKVRNSRILWRERLVSANKLAIELGCSVTTVTVAARALGYHAINKGNGKRWLFDTIQAEILCEHLRRKLARHRQNREAGRLRHAEITSDKALSSVG